MEIVVGNFTKGKKYFIKIKNSKSNPCSLSTGIALEVRVNIYMLDTMEKFLFSQSP